MYFGRQVALSDRTRITEYALGQRKYIGPTSMDTEMAFIMANMGKVRAQARGSERVGASRSLGVEVWVRSYIGPASTEEDVALVVFDVVMTQTLG